MRRDVEGIYQGRTIYHGRQRIGNWPNTKWNKINCEQMIRTRKSDNSKLTVLAVAICAKWSFVSEIMRTLDAGENIVYIIFRVKITSARTISNLYIATSGDTTHTQTFFCYFLVRSFVFVLYYSFSRSPHAVCVSMSVHSFPQRYDQRFFLYTYVLL